jgi:hypothetical protein
MSDKSLLAKLLATENIIVQRNPALKTAAFDLKSRILMLPVWQGISNDLEDLLLVHETGHALDTPTGEIYKQATDDIAARVFPGENVSPTLRKTVQGFLNVIEDVRIDKRQKRRYPGCRRNYLIGYKELIDRDFFGTANRDINTMNFIDRLNIYFKNGHLHMNIAFSSEEKVLLKKVEQIETWNEVVSITEEIYLYCKKKLEEAPEMENDLLEGKNDDSDFDIYDDDLEENDKDEDYDGDENSENQGVNSQSDNVASSGHGKGGGADNNLSNVPRSETDETWQRKSEDIVKNDDTAFVYVSFPNVDWNKAVNDYKIVLNDWRKEISNENTKQWTYSISYSNYAIARSQMMAWKNKEKESISFMVKEFEQRKAAELYARISVAKTGVIDTNKLHSYKYNDDIFRRIATIPKGKNHGFVMFIDWSGSMIQNLGETVKQLLSLCMFCRQIGVPFEVYGFKDCNVGSPFTYSGKQNVIKGRNLVLRNFLSSRMNTEEMNFAMAFLWCISSGNYSSSDGMSGTPLNDAIMIAPKIVRDFTARNKLEITNVIWLTDGESNACAGIENSTEPRHVSKVRYLYVDPATNKTYDWNNNSWYGTRNNTNTLLRILKDNTDCNLIGFYLCDYGSFKRLDLDFNICSGNGRSYMDARKYWQDNKYYPVKSAGYDEYYVIDANAMRQTENNLEIDNSGEKKMSVKKMALAFSKFAQKKTVNRILLRQFVERIARHSKKVA